MNSQVNNPMAEYLFKLQLIIKASEFKNREEANKYETPESRTNGDKYINAKTEQDIFESYTYDEGEIYLLLMQAGYPEDKIKTMMTNTLLLPSNIRSFLLQRERQAFINLYNEPNKYYCNLTGKPFMGNDNTQCDRIISIPDEFYERYKDDTAILRGQAVHELPYKYQELLMNSEFYQELITKYPDAIYLRYIGSNAIPIEVSRKARDGDIMRINENKLHAYHHSYGNVTVDASIVHAFSNIYKSTRDYVYGTLRGDFANIYANYNSLIRFLTIYMAIGSALNEFQKKSSKLIYMNNTTANNYFVLYGLPSVIMEGSPKVEFLKKFRMLLMDKGTNTVYRVKDMIGYENTDVYTLIMVKQQVFENGMPVYHYNEDGTKTPVTNIVFRRYGTAEDNASYFKFRDSKREYSLEEITSGDPRWWGGKEVDAMLEDMNYTLSNSKYIQLATCMSSDDIWWQLTIFLRGLLDRKNETSTIMLNTDRAIDNKAAIMLYDAVLSLIIMMHWHLKDAYGSSLAGYMYMPDTGMWQCIDKLFNGLTGLIPNPLKDGGPYQVASFNFDIIYDDRYREIVQYEYLNPSIFVPMMNKILNRENANIADALMRDIKLLYKYLEDKLQQAKTIHEFRQVSNTYNALFLVDPVRRWNEYGEIKQGDTFENLLMIQNPSLYEYITQQRNEGDESILLVIRSIIQSLEEYSNSSLAGLQLRALGSDEYFRILKEVITYFKSYMVEFTKAELTYIFGGLFDNGGNTDKINLYDEITSGVLEADLFDSMTIFDVSCADTYYAIPDDGLMTIRDEAIFRLKAAYKNIINCGYEIWYDNKKRITKKPSFDIDDDTEVIADIVKAGDSYKAIINIEDVDNGYPPGYYGNIL